MSEINPQAEADELAKPFKEIAETLPNAPVAPATGVAAIALSMAMKYHDMNLVKDGALYQQYKLEGRNFETLHLDMVFETAMKIEVHLLGSSSRIAQLIVDALEVQVVDDPPASADKSKETPASD